MSDSETFVHLRARSAYSLLESMLHVKALGALAKKHHMPALALTDSNNLFGALEFSEALAEKGVQPIVGCSLTVRAENGEGVLALLAQSEAGYGNLMRLSTAAYLDTPASEEPHVPLARVLEHSEGLIALTGGQASLVNTLIEQDVDAKALVEMLARAFSNRLYVELQRHDEPNEGPIEERLIGIAYELGLPLAATNDLRFEKRSDHRAHDALMCIAASSYIGEEERPRVSAEHYFKSAAEMRALFADVPEAIEQSIDIARRCSYRVPTRRPIMPRFATESGRTETEELTAQAEEGLRARLEFIGKDNLAATEEKYWERLKFELGVIVQMGFPGYFLIVADFIKWAKAQNIPVGPGRGSGAGSVVAWALTITDLDPLRFGLFFERFLNPERISMPDFDIDFCQERRGEVIDYVKNKYGADRVAQIITFGTLQARAVLRDVGRVMQLPYGQVDRLAKMVPANPANPVTLLQAIDIEPRLKQEAEEQPEVAALLDVAQQLEGLHRNASTHAAGIVIGDRPLVELVGLYRDPRSDIPATQFNMKWVEPAGLVKFDFLGLKTLTVLKTCVDLIAKRAIAIDLARIPLDDQATFDLLGRAETVGVFQLESTGMKDVLRKMKPDKFEDIIALVALYRPGPMDDIPKYIACKTGVEQVSYPHAMLEPILNETYGVIVYQEQAMQIAQVLSGYSLGEADILRRAMGKKIPAEMAKQKSRFVDGAAEKGVDRQTADYIFDLVAKFAGYGFNKGHSAPYGLLAYQTAYLKANYPVEFIAASMTLDADNTDKLATFRQDARRMEVDVLPPDINASEADFAVQDESVRYALGAVRNVSRAAMAQIAAERAKRGKFKDLFDFAERIDPKMINKRALENLARAGAFDSLEPDRARALAACELVAAVSAKALEERNSPQTSLFGDAEPLARPPLPKVAAWSAQERLDNERESVGFYVSGHPLDDFLAHAPADKYATYADILEEGETEPRFYNMAGVVRRVQLRPAQSGGMLAYVSMSDPTAEFELMIMPENVQRARETLEVGKPLLFKARARWRDGDLKMSADAFEPIEAAEARVMGDLKIIVSENASMAALAETFAALRNAPRNGSDSRNLRLILKLQDGREIEMSVKGQYPAGASARAALKAAKGVERVA